jgi:hypothetical protein
MRCLCGRSMTLKSKKINGDILTENYFCGCGRVKTIDINMSEDYLTGFGDLL